MIVTWQMKRWSEGPDEAEAFTIDLALEPSARLHPANRAVSSPGRCG
jgi:hypothetical protein